LRPFSGENALKLSVPRGALRVTPRQLYEAARLLDRAGDATLTDLDGRLGLLVDRDHVGQPDLVLELGPDGEVLARRLLTRYVAEGGQDDELDDFVEVPPAATAPAVLALGDGARPAKPCKCSDPFEWDEPGVCARCGHRLAGGRVPRGTRA
jgi:hypothetical protein